MTMPTTCNHQRAIGLAGLCEDCQAEYDEDPSAYEEYGPHQQGERNWAALQAELAADNVRDNTMPERGLDPDFPF